MLDVNDDGILSYDEIYRMYKMLYHSSLSDDQIAALVFVVLDREDLETPGQIRYGDFVKVGILSIDE